MRRFRPFLAAAAAAMMLCLASCSTAPARKPEEPSSGPMSPAPAPAASRSPEAEAAELNRGREMAARLFSRDPLILDQRLLRYVNLVGRAAAADVRARERFHFAVTQSGVPYSLALPGGFVVVSRGAIARMSSEAELAVTLAREICREESVGAAAESPEREANGGDADLEVRWDACGARLASSAGYDAAAFLHYLQALEVAAASSRERSDLHRRIELYEKLPECSRGGQTLAERFRRFAIS